MVCSTDYSSRIPLFDSQHPHSQSTPSVTPVLQTCFSLHTQQSHLWPTDAHEGKAPIICKYYKIIINTNNNKNCFAIQDFPF